MTLRIPDVSNYQGLVDWAQVVASGRAGGIVKATEGTNFVDGQFIRNWTALAKLGVVRGAYHFARVGSSKPEQQAQRFLSIVATWKPTDLLILDLEVGDADLSGWALGWLRTVRQTTGVTPWLYSYGPFIRAHLTDPALAAYPLWIAAYQTTPPPCPPPWKTYGLWQHTDRAVIPGIADPCDESVGTINPPTPPEVVQPMYDPPLTLEPVVADLLCPTGGVWLLAASGAVYAFGGAPYLGAPNGKPYFSGRRAAQLRLVDSKYQVVATSGEAYGPGFD